MTDYYDNRAIVAEHLIISILLNLIGIFEVIHDMLDTRQRYYDMNLTRLCPLILRIVPIMLRNVLKFELLTFHSYYNLRGARIKPGKCTPWLCLSSLNTHICHILKASGRTICGNNEQHESVWKANVQKSRTSQRSEGYFLVMRSNNNGFLGNYQRKLLNLSFRVNSLQDANPASL